MKHYLLDGHKIMSITGRVTDHGGEHMQAIGKISEIRFSDGSRLSNVIMSNLHLQFLETDEPVEFMLVGDRQFSVLLAVKTPDGEIVDLDQTAFMAEANALTLRGCCMLPGGLLFAIVVIGIPFLLIACACFYQASTARMRVRLARRIVERGGFTDADLDWVEDRGVPSQIRSLPQSSAA